MQKLYAAQQGLMLGNGYPGMKTSLKSCLDSEDIWLSVSDDDNGDMLAPLFVV